MGRVNVFVAGFIDLPPMNLCERTIINEKDFLKIKINPNSLKEMSKLER